MVNEALDQELVVTMDSVRGMLNVVATLCARHKIMGPNAKGEKCGFPVSVRKHSKVAIR